MSPHGTRRDILDAALRLFAERGFAGASIRDVATAAGVQPPSLYAHYPSKEHILAELVEIGHREHQRQIRAALLESDTDPRHQLAAVVRAHVTMHAEYSMLAVVANAELHMLSPEVGATAFELRGQSEEILRDVIRRGVERGVFRTPHEWLAGAAIGGMGIRVAYWFPPDFDIDAASVADAYAGFALRIVAAEEAG